MCGDGRSEVLLKEAGAQYIYAITRRRISVTATTMPILTELDSLVKHIPVIRNAIICAFGGPHGVLADAPSQTQKLFFVPNVASREPRGAPSARYTLRWTPLCE